MPIPLGLLTPNFSLLLELDGGGGGELKTISSFPMTPGIAYSVTVGTGSPGSNSTFDYVTALGGGAGGAGQVLVEFNANDLFFSLTGSGGFSVGPGYIFFLSGSRTITFSLRRP